MKAIINASATTTKLLLHKQNPIIKTLNPFSTQTSNTLSFSRPTFTFLSTSSVSLPFLFYYNNNNRPNNTTPSFKSYHTHFSCTCCISTASTNTNYEFYDCSSEVELRLPLLGYGIQNSKDIFVDADCTSLLVSINHAGSTVTLIETNCLFEKIKTSETIWFIDDDQLVINLKKQDPDVKWPDIIESWESLTAGSSQLLKGTSIYLVGESTEINQKVARELAVGIGYMPLDTQELLETFSKQTIDAWALTEGSDSVAEAENAVLESISSHVRAVISTLGGTLGAAGRADKWRHLHAGFSVWLSQTEASDEESAKAEAERNKQDGLAGYSKADVVVKLQGWDRDPNYAKSVAQACLSGLKQLILSDKKLPGKKSLYIRLGCRGDWPNIKPPGWDPSTEAGLTSQ